MDSPRTITLDAEQLAHWAGRLRAAIAEEKASRTNHSTHARVTKVISRDGIRSVIAEMEATR